MVQQYNQNNINAPRGSTLFSADAVLDLDSDLAVVTTAAAAVTLTLPTALQIPGEELKVKANDAGSTGNAVTIAALAGQNIDGAATIQLTTDQESVCLKSDGSNWRVVCGGSGGGGAPVRAILPVLDATGDPPILAYQVSPLSAANVMVIRGESLTGITVVDVTTDVQVGGNTGAPPTIVGAPVVLDTSITVTLDGAPTGFGDKWGIILRDADGNVYGAPSPISVTSPL